MNKNKYNVAIVGATGLVGKEMLTVLEESSIVVGDLHLLASTQSVGTVLQFRDKSHTVHELDRDNIPQVDIALFSAGSDISQEFCPLFARKGSVVIDNSSAFRMDDSVPLVIPEVNEEKIVPGAGIIANPNCSTIQMLLVVKPLHDLLSVKRIVVSTYQSVSGVGKEAVDELFQQIRDILNCRPVEVVALPGQIAFNIIPHIDYFHEDGSTHEEVKMINETHKILEDNTIGVSATAVRVPTFVGHGEAVNIEFNKEFTVEQVKEILAQAPGIRRPDENDDNSYPMPIDCVGKDEVMVGRIRRDSSLPSAVNLWIVGDNLRKGAALNAVQIAERWIARQ